MVNFGVRRRPILFAGMIYLGLAGAMLSDEEKPKKTAAEVDPTCKKADETFEAALRVAEDVATRAKRDAAAARLKTYKSQLALATKSGDFDKATAIKAAIEVMEADPEGIRPKPKDVLKFEGHSYALIRDPVTWHIAKRRCEDMGGYLACLESPKEIAFIANALKVAGADAWIGCSDEEKEGAWTWVNGKPASLPGANPDNAHGAEHHMHWNKGLSTWHDYPAGVRIFYVCEWNQ